MYPRGARLGERCIEIVQVVRLDFSLSSGPKRSHHLFKGSTALSMRCLLPWRLSVVDALLQCVDACTTVFRLWWVHRFHHAMSTLVSVSDLGERI